MYEKPFRLRSSRYLMNVRLKPCLICGGYAHAHHIQYAQPRALGRKTGDQWTVPVCGKHHHEIHNSPMPERTWWALKGIDPMIWARNEYERWRRKHATAGALVAGKLQSGDAGSDSGDDGAGAGC